MALNYYELRKRVFKLVTDLMSNGYDSDAILFAAYSKYGASKKMVLEMIMQIEAQVAKGQKKVRAK